MRHPVLLVVIFALNCMPASLRASPDINQALQGLDKNFQNFSREFYQQAIRSNFYELVKYNSIPQLASAVETLIKSDKASHAISLIHFNYELVQNNIDTLEVIKLTKILLEHNDLHGARRILQTVQNEGGKITTSNISYTFAKYYMQRKEWRLAMEHLQGIINDLSEEDANYARIMVGTILQYQKQHRKAVEYYQKVNKSSRYYASAVLNTAIAYIRQDWWTDAYILINDLIKKHPNAINDVMEDRLHLVIGYALLRKQYFRNSRDAFRNVGLKSPYTNKALLGIALTAVNQDDFIGALNAITILKGKKTTDLSVDESYLLLPYTYGKLKQNMTATSAYSDAINYYQKRISDLTSFITTDEALLNSINISTEKASISLHGSEFSYSSSYPDSFFKNYIYLSRIGKDGFTNKSIQSHYASLLIDHKKMLAKMCRTLINERIDYLKSYLNQSRYGLARLYDSTLVSTK